MRSIAGVGRLRLRQRLRAGPLITISYTVDVDILAACEYSDSSRSSKEERDMSRSAIICRLGCVVLLFAAFAGPTPVLAQRDTGATPKPAWRFDMGTPTSPVAPGYVKITRQDLYTPSSGYGWVSKPEEDYNADLEGNPVNLEATLEYCQAVIKKLGDAFIERGKEVNDSHKVKFGEDLKERDYREHATMRFNEALPDHIPWLRQVVGARDRDSVMSSQDLVFRVDLPNGRYQVVAVVGDYRMPRLAMNIEANGRIVAEDLQPKRFVFRGSDHYVLGWQQRAKFPVDVSDGKLVIRVYGDETGFREKLAESVTPDTFVTSFLHGRVTEFKGKKMNVHGHFTKNSLMYLEIGPDRALPLRREGTAVVSDDPALSEFVNLYNSGQINASFDLVNSVRASGYDLEKALAYLHVAAHPDFQRELKTLDKAIPILAALASRAPDDVVLEDLLNQADLLKRADAHLANSVKPMQDYNQERCKAGALFRQLRPDDLLYPKALVQGGRTFCGMDAHRWTYSWTEGLDFFQSLDKVWPGTKYADLYLRNDTSRFDIPSYREGTEGAPDWAVELHENYNFIIDHAEWWFRNRQQPGGGIGGGWGDDVEVGLFWEFATLANPGASELLRRGTWKLAEGVWQSGEINRDVGYFHGIADVEHTAEWTGDSIPPMIGIEYGNPVWLERAAKTVKLMRDLWMGRTPRGHLHFKSIYLGDRSIDQSIITNVDHPLNGRAATVGLWYWWYSGNKTAEQIFREWTDAWLEDTLREENFKPRGVVPGPVGFLNDEIGGNKATQWFADPRVVDFTYAVPHYSQYVYGLFATMYEATGDMRYVEPFEHAVRAEVEYGKAERTGARSPFIQKYYDAMEKLPLKPTTQFLQAWEKIGLSPMAARFLYGVKLDTGTTKYDELLSQSRDSAYRFFAEGDKRGLVRQLASANRTARERWPFNTSEASQTDRIGVPGGVAALGYIMGGDLNGGLATLSATYDKMSRHTVPLVRTASQTKLWITVYSFDETPQTFLVRPWKLKPGATYKLSVGIDDDGDDAIDEEIYGKELVLRHRGDPIEVEIPNRRSCVVQITQTDPGKGIPKDLPDLGISSADIAFSDGKLWVSVHNLGNLNAPPFAIEVRDAASGELIGTRTVAGLEAPNDLEPRTVTIQFPWQPSGGKGRVEVRVDPPDEVLEITELNNVAAQEVPPPPPEIPAVDWVEYRRQLEMRLRSVPAGAPQGGRGGR